GTVAAAGVGPVRPLLDPGLEVAGGVPDGPADTNMRDRALARQVPERALADAEGFGRFGRPPQQWGHAGGPVLASLRRVLRVGPVASQVADGFGDHLADERLELCRVHRRPAAVRGVLASPVTFL